MKLKEIIKLVESDPNNNYRFISPKTSRAGWTVVKDEDGKEITRGQAILVKKSKGEAVAEEKPKEVEVKVEAEPKAKEEKKEKGASTKK